MTHQVPSKLWRLGPGAMVMAMVMAMGLPGQATAGPGCAASASDRAGVMMALNQWYAAMRQDDLQAFAAATTPDFLAYDAGGSYRGLELARAIKAAHERGTTFVWSITDPEVQVDSQSALVTYVNRGQVKNADGPKDVVWLESAALRRTPQGSKLAFFHSSKAKASP